MFPRPRTLTWRARTIGANRALVGFAFHFQISADLRQFGNDCRIHDHINRAGGILDNEGGPVRHDADDHALDFDRVPALCFLPFHLVDGGGGRQHRKRSAVRIRISIGCCRSNGVSINSISLRPGTSSTPGTFCPVVVKALWQNPMARIRRFNKRQRKQSGSVPHLHAHASAHGAQFQTSKPSGCSVTNVTSPSTSAQESSSPSRRVWPMASQRISGNASRPITSSRNGTPGFPAGFARTDFEIRAPPGDHAVSLQTHPLARLHRMARQIQFQLDRPGLRHATPVFPGLG